MDQALFLFINTTLRHPFWDVVMAALSSWAVWWPLVVVTGVLVLVWGGFKGRAMVLAAVLAIAVNDGLVCRMLKDAVQRPRPGDVISGVRKIDLGKAKPRIFAVGKPLRIKTTAIETPATKGQSFPSSHAANCFAMATVCFLFYRRFGWFAFLPAAMVAFSRVYVGSHWPTDAMAGALIGVLCAVGTVYLLRYLWFRLSPHFVPSWHAAYPDFLQP
jgi:membrane-associated phospholipid phosphatase